MKRSILILALAHKLAGCEVDESTADTRHASGVTPQGEISWIELAPNTFRLRARTAHQGPTLAWETEPEFDGPDLTVSLSAWFEVPHPLGTVNYGVDESISDDDIDYTIRLIDGEFEGNHSEPGWGTTFGGAEQLSDGSIKLGAGLGHWWP